MVVNESDCLSGGFFFFNEDCYSGYLSSGGMSKGTSRRAVNRAVDDEF